MNILNDISMQPTLKLGFAVELVLLLLLASAILQYNIYDGPR